MAFRAHYKGGYRMNSSASCWPHPDQKQRCPSCSVVIASLRNALLTLPACLPALPRLPACPRGRGGEGRLMQTTKTSATTRRCAVTGLRGWSRGWAPSWGRTTKPWNPR